jgi:hypothetical protein
MHLLRFDLYTFRSRALLYKDFYDIDDNNNKLQYV